MTMDDDDNPSAPAQNGYDKPRGRPFAPGTSGNPNGRPKGSRNRAALEVEALLEAEGVDIIRSLIEAAREGNIPAARLCLDRILPRRRDRPVEFELPPITTAADARKALAVILTACAEGRLTASEADARMNLVERYIRILQTSEFDARLTQLTELAKKNSPPRAGSSPPREPPAASPTARTDASQAQSRPNDRNEIRAEGHGQGANVERPDADRLGKE
jgi:hypothetical protein